MSSNPNAFIVLENQDATAGLLTTMVEQQQPGTHVRRARGVQEFGDILERIAREGSRLVGMTLDWQVDDGNGGQAAEIALSQGVSPRQMCFVSGSGKEVADFLGDNTLEITFLPKPDFPKKLRRFLEEL